MDIAYVDVIIYDNPKSASRRHLFHLLTGCRPRCNEFELAILISWTPFSIPSKCFLSLYTNVCQCIHTFITNKLIIKIILAPPPPEQRYWQHRETANVGLDSSEPRHVNPDAAGSSPALERFSLFNQIYLKMYPISFPCGLLHGTYYKIKIIGYCYCKILSLHIDPSRKFIKGKMRDTRDHFVFVILMKTLLG